MSPWPLWGMPLTLLPGSRAAVRAAPDRAGAHPVCRSELRHDPAEAAQDRGSGARLGAADQGRDGLRLPLPAPIRARSRPITSRRHLSAALRPPPTTEETDIAEPTSPPPVVTASVRCVHRHARDAPSTHLSNTCLRNAG